MASDNPFANLGLGMMGNDMSYARKGMSGSSSGSGNEFLGGLLSFMGVGQDTQNKVADTVKDFKTNPFAAAGPKTTSDMYGTSPNAMGPVMPPAASASPVAPVAPTGPQPLSYVAPVTVGANPPAQPTANIFDQQRQQTQDILSKLIPRNLPNTPQ